MNNFDELLYRLIRNNRRVIIPDIGAFITNAPDENTVFSPLLKYNDGFLEDELHKENIANPAIFLRELAENIISVIERGQHFHIAGLGYFVKDESIRFEFEKTDCDDIKPSDEVVVPLQKTRDKTKKSWIAVCAIFLCAVILVMPLSLIFDMHDSSKKLLNRFTSQRNKPDNQFVIVDKSDNCDETDNFESFSPTANFHLVIACFEEKENAENFVRQCKKNGYDKAEILCVTTALYSVSIGSFASSDEAATEKRKYDEKFGENSLIIKTEMILN
jgi:hypothetical protein